MWFIVTCKEKIICLLQKKVSLSYCQNNQYNKFFFLLDTFTRRKQIEYKFEYFFLLVTFTVSQEEKNWIILFSSCHFHNENKKIVDDNFYVTIHELINI